MRGELFIVFGSSLCVFLFLLGLRVLNTPKWLWEKERWNLKKKREEAKKLVELFNQNKRSKLLSWTKEHTQGILGGVFMLVSFYVSSAIVAAFVFIFGLFLLLHHFNKKVL